MSDKETAVCRGCGRELVGTPYHQGGNAYIPETMERAKVNHYGGYVCGEQCDLRVTRDVGGSMSGRVGQFSMDSIEREALSRNWKDRS